MSAAALLAQKAHAGPTPISDDAMTGNICRCGTYPRIRAAIHRAAALQAATKKVRRVMRTGQAAPPPPRSRCPAAPCSHGGLVAGAGLLIGFRLPLGAGLADAQTPGVFAPQSVAPDRPRRHRHHRELGARRWGRDRSPPCR
jgi:hypothetical protein